MFSGFQVHECCQDSKIIVHDQSTEVIEKVNNNDDDNDDGDDSDDDNVVVVDEDDDEIVHILQTKTKVTNSSALSQFLSQQR